MRIDINDYYNEGYLEELKYGETFYYDTSLFLKIQKGDVFCPTKEEYLCVDLYNSELVLLDKHTVIEKIRTKLVRDE
jgi:hypothetical protein